jgi:adenylate kinase family enzyme
MDDIIQEFMECDSAQSERLRKMMKVEGRGIDDTLTVSLLYKKLQSKECLKFGWVLEDFPKTKNQAIAMAKQGLTPYNVINVRITQEECYTRTAADQATDFEAFRTILAQKLRYMEKNLIHVCNFYQRAYNSLIEIDGFKSKWYMEDRAMTVIKANIDAR